MRCFCYGNPGEIQKDNQNGAGYVCFTIPDIGIAFKAAFSGKPEECEYTSLLALLEFVDLNPQLFQNKNLEIFSDSFAMVHQVNMKLSADRELEPFRNMALSYKKKIPYTLNWISKGDNPALGNITVN
ncbi:MAG: hypothetical protein CO189_12045 [candidate division Zixibacteria bacterium CG_4_9_14_3_um_filter_46_8]|nr:MAG: hypothetical protein CO189_12045 [candidate division Zixibacteria bacterium CG_4_9_14_3_um_filter_46_8]